MQKAKGKQVGTNLLPYSRRSRCQKKNHERKQFRMIAIFIRFKFLLGRPFNKFSHPMHIHTSKTTYIQTVRNYKTEEWSPLYKLSTSGMFSFFTRCFERFLSPSCFVYSLRQNLCLWQNIRSVRKIGEKMHNKTVGMFVINVSLKKSINSLIDSC